MICRFDFLREQGFLDREVQLILGKANPQKLYDTIKNFLKFYTGNEISFNVIEEKTNIASEVVLPRISAEKVLQLIQPLALGQELCVKETLEIERFRTTKGVGDILKYINYSSNSGLFTFKEASSGNLKFLNFEQVTEGTKPLEKGDKIDIYAYPSHAIGIVQRIYKNKIIAEITPFEAN